MIRLEDPVALGLVAGGFVFGLAIGWLCGVTWHAGATLRRDAHLILEARQTRKLADMVGALARLRVREVSAREALGDVGMAAEERQA